MKHLKLWGKILLYMISSQILIGILSIPVVLCAYYLSPSLFNQITSIEAGMTNELILIQAFLSIIGVVIITYIFRVLIDKKSFKSLGFLLNGYGLDFISGSMLGVVLVSVGFIILLIFGMLQVESYQFVFINLIIGLFGIFCLAFFEEILIRGYILKTLLNKYSKYSSLVMSSIIFALMHGLNPNINFLALVNLLLAGMLLGNYYIYKKNLWFPTGLHFTWNYFQGYVLGFEISGLQVDSIITQKLSGSDLLTGGDFGFEGSILCTLICIIGIYFIDYKYRCDDPKEEVSEAI